MLILSFALFILPPIFSLCKLARSLWALHPCNFWFLVVILTSEVVKAREFIEFISLEIFKGCKELLVLIIPEFSFLRFVTVVQPKLLPSGWLCQLLDRDKYFTHRSLLPLNSVNVYFFPEQKVKFVVNSRVKLFTRCTDSEPFPLNIHCYIV